MISAGTGLGEAFLVWDGRDYVPYPSEGGHSDYAPRNDDEIDLLRFLKQKYNGRISFERVVSGQGITNCYEFLREVRGMEEPAWLAEQMTQEDPNAAITEAALKAKPGFARRRWTCLCRRMERRPVTSRSRFSRSADSTWAEESRRAFWRS